MGYDTVRYQYMNKLPFDDAPEDDRELPAIFALACTATSSSSITPQSNSSACTG